MGDKLEVDFTVLTNLGNTFTSAADSYQDEKFGSAFAKINMPGFQLGAAAKEAETLVEEAVKAQADRIRAFGQECVKNSNNYQAVEDSSKGSLKQIQDQLHKGQ